MNLRTRIVLLGMTQLVIISVVLFVFYVFRARSDARAQLVDRARAMVQMAEATRNEMARKWSQGIFSADLLRQWADAGEVDRILAAVPVVTAWRAAMDKAEENGYAFRVPKFNPRNPKHEPDAFEARVLRRLREQGLEEYYEIDPETNALRYFRPIRLTEECMLCHGDPARSAQYWGNDEGLDPTGTRMEGWQVGEVHGAFELIAPLDQVNSRIASAVSGGGLLVVLLVMVGGFVFYRYASRTLDSVGQIALELDRGAGQVTAASQQVASSAQQIAEGASQQAASLEQTSSAVEELAAQTRSSADAAQQAVELGQRARQAATRGTDTTDQLNTAMEAINESSVQIGRIIKVVEEIAFQTNLLALNAAVEAARAGEHGKGFAVVADEVRNLAQRAAEASREIAMLVEDSVSKAKDGARVAESVGDALRVIIQDVEQVTSLLDGIAQSNEEQAEGVSQMNHAITQIDRVTQSNAASAEQSASTAQELAAQATMVQTLVQRLRDVIGVSCESDVSRQG